MLILPAIFGEIKEPYMGYGDLCGGGLIAFLSNLLKLVITLGGISVMIIIVIAGLQYVTSSGDPKKVASAGTKIYMAIIGLLIMVASFVIAAVAGQLLFGSPTAILNPQVYGPGGC